VYYLDGWMLNKIKIGKIQFYFGIVLLVFTIIVSIFIIKGVFFETLTNGIESTTSAWSGIEQELENKEMGVMGHIVSNVVLQGMIIKTTGFLFFACALILVVLSIILILQGLANQVKK
jgi:hypothetical protein